MPVITFSRKGLFRALDLVMVGLSFKNEESAQRGSFWDGHPGVIRADIPAQNFGQGCQNLGKNQAFRRGHP